MPTPPVTSELPVTRTVPLSAPAVAGSFVPAGLAAADVEPVAAMPQSAPSSPQRPAGVALRTHTIVDGDSLPKLARRYLGSAERSGEILALNRDVLPDPDLLPIGTEIKLPAAR